MGNLPFSCFDVTITSYFKTKDPALFDLLRLRYKHAFSSVIGSLMASKIDDDKTGVVFEQATRDIYHKLRGKFTDLKSLEEHLCLHFIGYLVILKNCNEQVDFLELKNEFRKKMRFYLKKQFLMAFPEKINNAVAPQPASYIFSFEDYVNGKPLAKLFIKGLFYEPLLCYTNAITNTHEEDKNIVENALETQYRKRKEHKNFTAMTNSLQNGCRSRAFEYLKGYHIGKPDLEFLFAKKV